jgi:hypothetical protein
MKKRIWISGALLLSVLSVIPVLSFAAEPSGGRQQGPPPEAITACEGKEAGDAVEFSGRNGETVKAVCKLHDDKLIAEPENMPERPGPR